MPTPAAMFNPADPPSLAVMLGKESELNWEARDRFLDALIGYCNETRSRLSYSFSGIGAFSGSFVDLRASMQLLPANDPRLVMAHWLKANYEDILLVLHTPRTQLCIRACQFVATYAQFLGPGLFDAVSESSLHHLLKLCGTTKKIIGAAASESLRTVAQLITPHRAASVLVTAAQDRNVNMRLRAFECLRILTERTYDDVTASTATIGGSHSSAHQRLWETIAEKILTRGLADANPDIRSCSASVFSLFKERLPDTAATYTQCTVHI